MNQPNPSYPLIHRYFAFIERRSPFEKLVFFTLLFALIASSLLALITLNNRYLVTSPIHGGVFVEGSVGTPRFVNPVLATTRVDRDLTALVYSGLLRITPDGELENDIAESITISEDGRTYTIVLRQGVRFHDGSELTARDVAYTISLIQNPDLKSPLRNAWEGVGVSVEDTHRITLTLQEAYQPFIENLTVGILPRAVWGELPIEQLPFSQHNTEPIGSGPYQITQVEHNAFGLISAYELQAFTGSGYEPAIASFRNIFYQDEEALLAALNKQEVDATASISVERLVDIDASHYKLLTAPLPRTFGLYFNQNQSALLRDQAVRQALAAAIDREAIIAQAVSGYGEATDTVLPAGFLNATTATIDTPPRPETILVEGGWQKNEAGQWEKIINDNEVVLSLTITTANTPLFEYTAALVADQWRAIGVTVDVQRYEQADLVQGVIRPRDFEVLLYGVDVGRAVDLYSFWHSSQKDDPGINITQYTNIEVDALLTTARTAEDAVTRDEAKQAVATIIADEQPAIMLFSPLFVYVVANQVDTVPFLKIGQPSDRMHTVIEWYVEKRALWSIFQEK